MHTFLSPHVHTFLHVDNSNEMQKGCQDFKKKKNSTVIVISDTTGLWDLHNSNRGHISLQHLGSQQNGNHNHNHNLKP